MNMMKSIILTFLLFAGVVQAEEAIGQDIIAWWKFEQVQDNVVIDSATGKKDKIAGNFRLIDGIKGKALKSDGFTTNVKRSRNNGPAFGEAATFEAWVALETYPWNNSAIITGKRNDNLDSGYYFGIDSTGKLVFGIAVEGSWRQFTSKSKIILYKWAHVAASFDPDQGLSVYINGQPEGTLDIKGKMSVHRGSPMSIARNTEELSPTFVHRPYGAFPSKYSFDGAIDELKIYNRVLTGKEIMRAYESQVPDNDPPFVQRRLPKGPAGLNKFRAYATNLKYYEQYDDVWRGDGPEDIVVSFDEYPIRIVAWRGIRSAPCMVTPNKYIDNDIWMADQSAEYFAGYDTPGGTKGCNEHMSDAQCRYSRVRLVENNDARIIIHWRYAPCDVLYRLPYPNGLTGWDTWIDEYYYIYPDAVYTRQYDVYADKRPDQLQETSMVNPPRTLPDDNVEKAAITVADMKGNSIAYIRKENFKRHKFPGLENPNIHMTNLKSDYRPFVIHDPKRLNTSLYLWNTGLCSYFSMWNHWPVSIQAPTDGRQAVAADRASSTAFVMTTFPPYKKNDRKETYVYLSGMTDKPAGQLAPLAKSWLYPAKLKLSSKKYETTGYQRIERAYHVSCFDQSDKSPLEFKLQGRPASPIVNPCFVIKNWGQADAALKVDGREIKRGKDFRYGHRYGIDGTDLIVWLKIETTKPVNFLLQPVIK